MRHSGLKLNVYTDNAETSRVFLDIYISRLEQDVHDEVRLETLAKSAQVLETQLEDLDGAAERCRTMLSLHPDHRFALKTLARIERSRENWTELFDVLTSLIDIAEENSEKATLIASQATLAAQYLDRPRRYDALRHTG